MTQSLKVLLTFIFTIILSVVLTPFLGRLYDEFFPGAGNWFWGLSNPEYIEGFIIAYMFALPLFSISLLEKKKIMCLLIGILPVLVFILWGRFGNLLIMGGILFIIGSLLGLLATKLSQIGEKK